ncbi:MAG: CBS domain-containing protein [Pirellulaceae bacterium]
MIKQIGEMLVSDYMTANVISVDDSAKLTAAIRCMDDEGLQVLPVLDEQGNVVGMLSTADLIQITHEIQADLSALNHVNESTKQFLIQMLVDAGDTTYVRDVMTSPVETIKPCDNLVIAAKILSGRHYRHLPVIDEEGKPVGILSTSDFVRVVAELGGLIAG